MLSSAQGQAEGVSGGRWAPPREVRNSKSVCASLRQWRNKIDCPGRRRSAPKPTKPWSLSFQGAVMLYDLLEVAGLARLPLRTGSPPQQPTRVQLRPGVVPRSSHLWRGRQAGSYAWVRAEEGVSLIRLV